MTSSSGLGRLEVLVEAADHERERAGLGADDAAGDRGVDGAVAGRDGERRAAARASSTSMVEESMNSVPGRRRAAASTARPRYSVEDVPAAGQHGDDDVGAGGRLGGGVRGRDAVRPACSSAAGTTSKPVTV